MRASLCTILALITLNFLASLALASDLSDEHLKADYPGFAKVYDELTPKDSGKVESLRTYDSLRGAIQGYDAANPAAVDAARAAMAKLYDLRGSSNLANVHWLLKIGAIDADTSAKIATIRNDMVRQICHEMAGKLGEVHKFDFSPAVNALNDIDHTFKPVEERGQTGPQLKKMFNELYEERFQINPMYMDVVSHPFEARIPDWRRSVDVDNFVVQLRQGSSLLSKNPEAYFLEGAFRMQVERRSYASDQLLYTVFAANHKVDATSVAELHISEKRGTVGELAYKLKRPEARRTYAWGSSVGNWFFFRAHGEGLRYAAKYGIRSFAEGPGWLLLPEDPAEGEALPKTWEELLTRVARDDLFEKIWDSHYEGKFDLPKEEMKWALQRSKDIRLAQDQYGAQRERIFREKALELAGTYRNYTDNQEKFIAAAEQLLISHMKQMMLYNMEVALPDRVGDWLEPKVNPHLLFKPDELEKMSPAEIDDGVKKAEKRLRVAALFETMHGLRTMEPEGRRRAIERAIARHPRFKRTLQGILRLVEPKVVILENGDMLEHRPNFLLTDEEAGRDPKRKKKVVAKAGKSAVELDTRNHEQRLDGHMNRLHQQLTEQLDEYRKAVQAEVLSGFEQAVEVGKENIPYVIDDFKQRLDRGIVEAKSSLNAGAQFVISDKMRTVAVRRMRREFLSSFGVETRKDWRAIEQLTQQDLGFNPKLLLSNTVTLANADTLIKVVQAYRSSGGNMEVVGNVVLLEAASRLPVIGTLMQIQGAASGDLLGGTVMVVGYFYPGVGQAFMVCNVAKGAWDIAVDVALDSSVAIYYQGTIPNADGSAGPGSGSQPISGILDDVFADLKLHRRELAAELEDPSLTDQERAQISKDLKEVYPLTVKGARNHLFNYYDAQLNKALLGTDPNQPRVPKDQWDAVKLSTNLGTVRKNDPELIYEREHLPQMLLAHFGNVVREFMTGTGEYARFAEHAKHPILQEQFYLSGGADWVEQQGVEMERRLSAALADAFARALRRKLKNPDADPQLVIDLKNWKSEQHRPILVGRDGASFSRRRAHGGVEEYEGEIPTAPSLLAIIPGETFAEKQRAFFKHHNDYLDRKLAAKTVDPIPREEWDAYKLGKDDATVLPEADENKAVKNAFLTAFFLSRIKRWRDDPTINRDESWMGERIWDPKKFARKLADQMTRDYIAGLTRDITRRKHQEEQRRINKRIPYALAVDHARKAIWGDDDTLLTAKREEVIRLLALHSGDAHLFPDADEKEFFLAAAAREAPPQSEVKIIAPPKELRVDSPASFQCQVRASRHFQRPFHFDWSLQGAKKPALPPRTQQSSLRYTALELGREFEDITKLVNVNVYDSSEPPLLVGTASAPVTASSEPDFEPQFEVKNMRPANLPEDCKKYVFFRFHVSNIRDCPLKSEHYAPLHEADEEFPHPKLLIRFDYDGITKYQELWYRAWTNVSLPVARVGKFRVKATMYAVLDNEEHTTWQHEFDIECLPPGRLKRFPPGNSWDKQIVDSRERFAKAKKWWQDSLQRGDKPNYYAMKTMADQYMREVRAHRIVNGDSYLRVHGKEIVARMEKILAPLNGDLLLLSNDCDGWRGMSIVLCAMLDTNGADRWLRKIEALIANPTRPVDRFMEDKRGLTEYIDTWGYERLLAHYAYHSWEVDKIHELIARHDASTTADPNDHFNTYARKSAEKAAARIAKFREFYPEAFAGD
ncbi:MAG: hypothetical protein AAF581_09805 [Planctomycetota bacterium]